MSVKLVSILLLLSFWFPGLCYAEPDLASQEVRVGVIAPLSGPVANRGQDIARTIELLKPELEALAPGFQFKFIIEDGRCGIGPAALGAGRRLLDVERVHFLIISCSGSSLQVGPLAQRSGVLTMVVYSLHEAVSNIGDFIFRTSPSVRGGIKKLAAETTERGYKRIAILSEESEFTDHMADVFADFKGSQVVERVSYRREDTDSRMLLLRLRKAQPDFIFFSVMNGYTLSDLLHKRDEIKWEVPIGTYGMVDTQEFRATIRPGAATGVLHIEQLRPLGPTDPKFAVLMERYVKRYGEPPSAMIGAMTIYDAVLAIVRGIMAVGPDAAKVRDFLRIYKTLGALGSISFDERGEVQGVEYPLSELQADGTSKLLRK